MLIRTVVSTLLGAGCHVVSDDTGRCVVVDPGVGVVDRVVAMIGEEGLVPLAVLVTHGHVDHTWDAAELCRTLGVPLHVHRDDAARLADPFGTLGPLGAELAAMARSLGAVYEEPADIRTFDGSAPLEVRDATGVPFPVSALHCPGHTAGSTVYLLPEHGTALTGDVLFAGSVGRTDLPGGDPQAMARTLRTVAELPPGTTVLPGHGPATTIGTELRTNPYLRTRG